MKDRREHPRASLIGLVEVDREANQPPVEGYGITLSLGGLSLYVREPVSGRVSVRLHFEDITGKQGVESISGRVAWQKKIGSWHAAGIEFDGLNPKDHSMTIEFLKRMKV